METQRPVLSEADQLYFERVAADCLDLLGPGMELTGLALDRRRSGHPAAELSPGDDRLDQRGPRRRRSSPLTPPCASSSCSTGSAWAFEH